MPTEQQVNVIAQFKPVSWPGVIAAYVSASALQVLIYGLAATSTRTSVSGGGMGELSEALLVLSWMLGPAALATVFAVRKLRFGAGAGTSRMTIPAAVSLLVLPLLSAYVGVLVSFNVWGT